MPVTFTSHNIVLDDGVLTRPESKLTISEEPWFKSAKRALEMVFPGNKRKFSIVDLGCLEGGYSVEFARMGFNALGWRSGRATLMHAPSSNNARIFPIFDL
jgi:hypothetical protein